MLLKLVRQLTVSKFLFIDWLAGALTCTSILHPPSVRSRYLWSALLVLHAALLTNYFYSRDTHWNADLRRHVHQNYHLLEAKQLDATGCQMHTPEPNNEPLLDALLYRLQELAEQRYLPILSGNEFGSPFCMLLYNGTTLLNPGIIGHRGGLTLAALPDFRICPHTERHAELYKSIHLAWLDAEPPWLRQERWLDGEEAIQLQGMLLLMRGEDVCKARN